MIIYRAPDDFYERMANAYNRYREAYGLDEEYYEDEEEEEEEEDEE